MAEIRNILLCGVGGQGTILAGKVLSSALLEAGFDVKMSEVHGMAQRGGSVTTQIRFGDKVYSPIFGKGSADVLLAFEAMEAYRYLDMLKPDGQVIVNDFRLPSATTLAGKERYPEDIIEKTKALADTSVLDAAGIAAAAGNPKSMNIALLGALAKKTELTGLDWEGAIRANVKAGTEEANIRAFEAGINAAAYGMNAQE